MRVVETSCDFCGSSDSEELARGLDYEYQTTLEPFSFVRCKACSYVYLNPRPADSELDAIYPPNYYSYVQRENRASGDGGLVGRLRTRYHCSTLRRAFGDFVRDDRPLRVLDVGCGDGRFLDLMRFAFGESVETHGIDFDEDAVTLAAKSGHRTQAGRIEDSDYPDAFFDVIYISHVIEHLPSPRTFCEISHRLLAEGGALHIETPNLNCAEARLFRRTYWGGYHFPRHWHLFTPETLVRLAGECGFDVRALGYSTSPVFLNWTFHHALWNHRLSRPLADIFSVTGIYRNNLHALVLLAGFSVVERVLRLFSGGRGSSLVCTLNRR